MPLVIGLARRKCSVTSWYSVYLPQWDGRLSESRNDDDDDDTCLLSVRPSGLVSAHSAEYLLASVKPSSSADSMDTDAAVDLIQRTIDLAGEGCGTGGGSIEIHPLHGSVLGQQHCFQVGLISFLTSLFS